MRTRYTIQVTQEDIDLAVKNNSRHCAVSTAVERQIPDAVRANTDIQTIRFTLETECQRLIYLTPAAAQEYITKFDAGEDIQPFTFVLQNPAYVVPKNAWIDGKIRHHPATASLTVSEITDGGKRTTKTVRVKASRVPAKTSYRHYGRRLMRENQ